jgi:small GTP-binding protein
MLGSFAVGKTSLIRRFVHSIFSDKYLTTIGVKIEKKTITIKDQSLDLMLWDIHGEDEFNQVRPSYFHGASGYLLVVDGTRRDTLDTAFSLHQRVVDKIGEVPRIMLFNKSDVINDWEIDKSVIEELTAQGWDVRLTSAKTGSNVERAFKALGRKMLEA